MKTSGDPEDLITEDDLRLIEHAVREAESGTSGEIRVHIDDSCDEDVLDRAAFVFAELEMHKTDLRNGVLIYLSLLDRKMAVIGDAGIHHRVNPGFWDEVRTVMHDFLGRDLLAKGICAGVQLAGEKLKSFYPVQANDRNELPNSVSRGRQHNKKTPLV